MLSPKHLSKNVKLFECYTKKQIQAKNVCYLDENKLKYYLFEGSHIMIKLFNSLTNQKEPFTPKDNIVNMYSCGPTVYYYAHIGNMRAYLFMDMLRKTLAYNGYDVRLCMNITDVGHLTSDADDGDDKMAVASKRENKDPWQIAKFYTDFFFDQAKKLNIDTPTYVVPATSVIDQIIDFVQGLLDKGYAYETSKGIYYDIKKFAGYGKLGGSVDDKMAGARIDVDPEKRNPADFALWVKAPKEHIMQWQSPWGMGYPGWHIECSTIGKKHFGNHIDIHTGGVDHKTIHHENEIAQSNALEGCQVVQNWMHIEFLQVDGGKMSKSLGNIYTIDDLIQKGYQPLDFRYFFMNAHYRKQQNFTFEALSAAHSALKSLREILKEHKVSSATTDAKVLQDFKDQFVAAINDDLNLPLALGTVWNLARLPRSKDVFDTIMDFDKVLCLDLDESISIPQNIKDLAAQRWQAKQNKDYKTSDELRQQISSLGYTIKDSKDGYEIVKN